MRQLVTREFVQLDEKTGTVQNVSRINTIEISNVKLKGSGFLLPPLTSTTFNNQTLYARCINGAGAEIIVVPFAFGAVSGGGNSDIGNADVITLDGQEYRIATNAEVLAMLEENFGEEWYHVATDEEIATILQNIFNGENLRIATDEEINAMLNNNFGTEG